MALTPGFRAGRHGAGLAFAIGGTALTTGLLLALHSDLGSPPRPTGTEAVAFDVPEAPKPKPKPTKPKPKPRKTTARPPPVPALTAGLAGMSFGLPGFDGTMDGSADALLGDVGDVVMTEDSVDSAPVPQRRVAPEYPPRARARNISGYVTVSLLVGADGSLQDITVLESSPPGVFETVATAAIRQWRFAPALYQGNPVTTRARQTLRFELE